MDRVDHAAEYWEAMPWMTRKLEKYESVAQNVSKTDTSGEIATTRYADRERLRWERTALMAPFRVRPSELETRRKSTCPRQAVVCSA
jgi:hypothetical protein